MFTEDEKRTIRENQLCLDNESMSMKLELLFAENKRLREALENVSKIDNKTLGEWFNIAKQALGE